MGISMELTVSNFYQSNYQNLWKQGNSECLYTSKLNTVQSTKLNMRFTYFISFIHTTKTFYYKSYQVRYICTLHSLKYNTTLIFWIQKKIDKPLTIYLPMKTRHRAPPLIVCTVKLSNLTQHNRAVLFLKVIFVP